jgi:hypothetical protein
MDDPINMDAAYYIEQAWNILQQPVEFGEDIDQPVLIPDELYAQCQHLFQLFFQDKDAHPEQSYIETHNNPLYADYSIQITRSAYDTYVVHVVLPEGHPDIGRNYMDIDMNVHGGIICGHENQFGINFTHLGDFIPTQPSPEDTVWTYQMVRDEGVRMIELFYQRAH